MAPCQSHCLTSTEATAKVSAASSFDFSPHSIFLFIVDQKTLPAREFRHATINLTSTSMRHFVLVLLDLTTKDT